MWRVHHSLADGISMVALVEQLFTHVDGSPLTNLLPKNFKERIKSKLPWYEVIPRAVRGFLKVAALPAVGCDDGTAFRNGINKRMVRVMWTLGGMSTGTLALICPSAGAHKLSKGVSVSTRASQFLEGNQERRESNDQRCRIHMFLPSNT